MTGQGTLGAVLLVCVCFFSGVESSKENNVCPTFADYYTIKNNSRCWYDFSAEFDAPTIIRLMGYKVAEFKVQTQDGHILTMFHISSPNNKNPKTKYSPVYLQHGLVSTCANFIGLRENSIAFLLADAGYDVWLGNFRGNQYSEEHVNLTVFDKKFWDHSMDEVAMFDLPASFRTILQNSPHGSKIMYIGHSLGTTLALMYAAEFPEEAKQTIKFFTLMSPAYTLSNMTSAYAKLAPFGDAILSMVNRYNVERLSSQAEPLKRLTRAFCLESPPIMQLCMQLYNIFYGKNTQMGAEIIPVYFNQLPGGTAIKILNHAADLVRGNFRKYNYGIENYRFYGRSTPPVYDITKIHVPVYIIYSREDWATTERDAWNLYYTLPRRARHGIRKINLRKFNHIDFVFGKHAREVVYNDLIEEINRFVENE